MRRLLLILVLLLAGCSYPPRAFHDGEAVQVIVDGRKGVVVEVVDPYVPSYRVRLHSRIIGYRTIVFHETELRRAR